ncbi:hypothetical protein FS837_012420, partial [Tulasnella sp. UAMH 9824]
AANTQYSSPAVESSCNNDDPSPLAGGCNPHRNRIDVPPELLIIILQASLPILNPHSLLEYEMEMYLKNLSLLRLVSRRWRDLVDDTPSLWPVLCSTIPRMVNQTSITRSGEAPVIVYFGSSHITFGRGHSDEHPDGFTELVGSIRDRWKVVWVRMRAAPDAWEYLNSPAPMIEAVHLKWSYPYRPLNLELLGGETHNIRYLDLDCVRIPWSRSEFRGLKHLELSYADGEGLTMDVILDVLANSSDMEYLSINSTAFPVSAAPFLHPIHLPHLRTIKLTNLPGPRIFPLLRHIEAPHCQIIHVIESEPGTNEWLDESIGLFEPLLREMHKRAGGSRLDVAPHSLDWRACLEPWMGNELGFNVSLRSNSFASLLRWVERVVDEADLEDLQMHIHISGETTLADPEVTSILRRLRSVTALHARSQPENGRETVRLLCNPDNPPLPILASLRLLRLDFEDMPAEELLQVLQTRSDGHCNQGGPRKLPDLKVVAELKAQARPVPSKSLPFTAITQIRSLAGVNFTFNRAATSQNGTLAIVWDNEEGVPK